MTQLIAFAGRSGAGKNTAAAALTTQGWAEHAFAEPLKAILMDWNPALVPSDVGEWDIPDNGDLCHDRLKAALSRHLPAIDVTDAAVDSILGITQPLMAGIDLASLVTEYGGFEQLKKSGTPEAAELRRLMQLVATEGIQGQFGTTAFADVLAEKVKDSLEQGQSVVVTDVRFDAEAQAIHDLGGTIIEVFRPSLGPLTDAHSSEAGISHHFVDQIVVNHGSVGNLHRLVLETANLDEETIDA